MTYTEVEPEAEEPVGGLAGVRQKGGRWRRITLVHPCEMELFLTAQVCVAMLVVIGVPLFVFTTVKSNKSCSWDYWEPPELIQVYRFILLSDSLRLERYHRSTARTAV